MYLSLAFCHAGCYNKKKGGKSVLTFPPGVFSVLTQIEHAGFVCYAVGGCVRDAMRGTIPQDYDLATDATPAQLIELLAPLPLVQTGIRHGTLTVCTDDGPVQITTFRTEQTYTDHRHPDRVIFVRSLQQDLARRDFTVNAMAYHPLRGLQDPFGGAEDLANGILRCVGVPASRFSEDALRILRAVRFSAAIGLRPEPQTFDALFACRSLLTNIAPERCASELCKTLLAPGGLGVLQRYIPVFAVPFPQICPTSFLPQRPTLAASLALCFPRGMPPYSVLPLPKMLRKQAQTLTSLLPLLTAETVDLPALLCSYGIQALNDACSVMERPTLTRAVAALPCPTLHTLALNGTVLQRCGLCGAEIQKALLRAQKAVNHGVVPNQTEALLSFLHL